MIVMEAQRKEVMASVAGTTALVVESELTGEEVYTESFTVSCTPKGTETVSKNSTQ